MSDKKYITLVSDTTLNDSDKVFTVPSGDEYRVLWGNVNLATTATVGNRQLDIQVRDASDTVLYTMSAGVVQAASLTYDYKLVPGAARETALTGTEIAIDTVPAELVLPGGYDLRVFDSAAIDPTADDMTVYLLVEVTD